VNFIGPTFPLVVVGVIILVMVIFVVMQMNGKKITHSQAQDKPPKGEAAYEWYIRRSILAQDTFDIKEIQQLERIRSLYFNRDTYPLVKEVMSNSTSIASIKDFPIETYKSDEDIEIVTFRDQNGRLYVATIYDSWELWQDPEVLDIFPLLETV
jgi:hypothetical protein